MEDKTKKNGKLSHQFSTNYVINLPYEIVSKVMLSESKQFLQRNDIRALYTNKNREIPFNIRFIEGTNLSHLLFAKLDLTHPDIKYSLHFILEIKSNTIDSNTLVNHSLEVFNTKDLTKDEIKKIYGGCNKLIEESKNHFFNIFSKNKNIMQSSESIIINGNRAEILKTLGSFNLCNSGKKVSVEIEGNQKIPLSLGNKISIYELNEKNEKILKAKIFIQNRKCQENKKKWIILFNSLSNNHYEKNSKLSLIKISDNQTFVNLTNYYETPISLCLMKEISGKDKCLLKIIKKKIEGVDSLSDDKTREEECIGKDEEGEGEGDEEEILEEEDEIEDEEDEFKIKHFKRSKSKE